VRLHHTAVEDKLACLTVISLGLARRPSLFRVKSAAAHA
jgi:hypothetical protein